MKHILINAAQEEEVRVAVVDNQRLVDLSVKANQLEQKKSNIYKGIVVRIEPHLDAAFVDYGGDRHGFLPLKEIAPAHRANNGNGNNGDKVSIKDVISTGQQLIVQIEKEERGNKGAVLTTQVNLASTYMVLTPNNSSVGGISRRVGRDERDSIRAIFSQLTIPDGMGLIIRTAGVGKSIEELQRGLDYLIYLWQTIERVAASREAPFLIYRDNEIFQILRDYLRNDVEQVVIDNKSVYEEVKAFVKSVTPSHVNAVTLYEDRMPLFTRYQIESQIQRTFERKIPLPSGGAIVIDHTEALVAIDINSARATRGNDIEETALNTNLEAAAEIGRQLRLRDTGGLVVIDFIDMAVQENRGKVEEQLRKAMSDDRARVQIGMISRFGLLELSRQRLGTSLHEIHQITCPRCSGVGVVRSVKSLSFAIIRLLEEEALHENTAALHVQAPVKVATYLLNEKRDDITSIEARHYVSIILVPHPAMDTPQFKIKRILRNQTSKKDSFEIIEEVDVEYEFSVSPTRERPALRASTDTALKVKKEGIIKRISSIFGSKEPADGEKNSTGRQVTAAPPATDEPRPSPARRSGRRRSRGGRGRGQSRQTQAQTNS